MQGNFYDLLKFQNCLQSLLYTVIIV